MNSYYVYKLIDPRTNKPFYVGKGKNNRMYDHVKNVKRGLVPNRNIYLYRKIKKILESGLDIEYEKVYDKLNENLAYQLEKQIIATIGINKLCNSTKGGMVPDPSLTKTPEAIEKWKISRNGYHHSTETKVKISKSNVGKKPWNRGKTGVYSEETIIKMSNSKKNKILTDEHKKNISKSCKGKKISYDTKLKLSTYWKNKRIIYESHELVKNCPICNKIQQYSSKKCLDNAIKKNTICKSCANSGYKNPSHRNKMKKLMET